jgi:tartrate-resistant acid phosphatase type 5
MRLRNLRFCFVMLSVVLASSIETLANAAETTQPSVHLLAMGDWGTNGPDQKAVAATMVKEVQSAAHAFDGVLLVGDNFYMQLPGGINDPMWQSCFEQMYSPAVLKMPFYAVLGNHDYQNGKDTIELDYAKANPTSRWKLPARWYRIDFPPAHPQVTVLMLDSNKDSMPKSRWDEQKQWMNDELAKPRGTWTLCCAHHPLFSNGGHGDNGVLQQQWGPMFVKYKVDFYICGHDHDLQHLQIPRWFTSFLLVGGGGAGTKMMRHDDRGPMSRLTHGFADLSFDGNTATVKYINEDGKLLHEFTRAKDGTVTVKVDGGDDKAAFNPLRALEGFGGYTPPATKP